MLWSIIGTAATSSVRRPNSAMDNPVRESSAASQRAKIILGTPPSNGVSAGQVKLFDTSSILADIKFGLFSFQL